MLKNLDSGAKQGNQSIKPLGLDGGEVAGQSINTTAWLPRPGSRAIDQYNRLARWRPDSRAIDQYNRLARWRPGSREIDQYNRLARWRPGAGQSINKTAGAR